MRYARRRAGGDEVAGLQRHELGEERDGPGGRKDHVGRVGILHGLAVDAGRDPQSRCAGRQLVGRDDPWAERACAIEVLARHPL